MQHIKTIQRTSDLKWVVALLIDDTQFRPLTEAYEEKADAVEDYRQQQLTRIKAWYTDGTWQKCEYCGALTEQLIKVAGHWDFRLCKEHGTPEIVAELFTLGTDYEEWSS